MKHRHPARSARPGPREENASSLLHWYVRASLCIFIKLVPHAWYIGASTHKTYFKVMVLTLICTSNGLSM